MSEIAPRKLDAREFYDRLHGLEGTARYELVDGQLLMMAGANNRHDRIVRNALRHLGNQLDGRRCQPCTADIFIAIPAGNRRHADAGIDCGEPEDESMEADKPAMVMAILSQTTRAFDRHEKLEEYKTVTSLEYIVIVDPDHPQVRVYRRDLDRAWISERLAGLDAVIGLKLLDVRIELADLYSGLVFRPGPRLVDPEGEASTKFQI